MLKNADCTIYEKGSFIRHTFEEVFWNDIRGAVTQKNAIQISDSVIVYIYTSDYVPKAGDIIIKGISSSIYDGSTQKAASESMNQLREQFPDYAVIKNVNDCRYGGLPHIEIIAR